MALLARLCSSCSRLPSAEEQRLRERALRSPSRSPRSRHRAISDSRHSIAPPSHTIRTHHFQKPTPDFIVLQIYHNFSLVRWWHYTLFWLSLRECSGFWLVRWFHYLYLSLKYLITLFSQSHFRNWNKAFRRSSNAVISMNNCFTLIIVGQNFRCFHHNTRVKWDGHKFNRCDYTKLV